MDAPLSCCTVEPSWPRSQQVAHPPKSRTGTVPGPESSRNEITLAAGDLSSSGSPSFFIAWVRSARNAAVHQAIVCSLLLSHVGVAFPLQWATFCWLPFWIVEQPRQLPGGPCCCNKCHIGLAARPYEPVPYAQGGDILCVTVSTFLLVEVWNYARMAARAELVS